MAKDLGKLLQSLADVLDAVEEGFDTLAEQDVLPYTVDGVPTDEVIDSLITSMVKGHSYLSTIYGWTIKNN